MTTQAIIFTPQARQAQADFREAMECLARPGRIGSLGGSNFPIAGARHAYALLLALADQEVTIATAGVDEASARVAGLGTGSRVVQPRDAAYLLSVGDPGELLLEMARGTLEAPEAGATIIISVDSLNEGERWTLSGPGVAGSKTVRVAGLSAGTLRARNEASSEYPLGLDLFLVDRAGAVLGLPRTTNVALEAQ